MDAPIVFRTTNPTTAPDHEAEEAGDDGVHRSSRCLGRGISVPDPGCDGRLVVPTLLLLESTCGSERVVGSMSNSVTEPFGRFAGLGSGDRFLSFPRMLRPGPERHKAATHPERRSRAPSALRCGRSRGCSRAASGARRAVRTPSRGARRRAARPASGQAPPPAPRRRPEPPRRRPPRAPEAMPAARSPCSTARLPSLRDAEPVLRELPSEGLVVDQADPLQAGEHVLDLTGLEPGGEEAPFQLPAAPRTHRQEPERALVTALRVLRRSRRRATAAAPIPTPLPFACRLRPVRRRAAAPPAAAPRPRRS